MDQQEQGPDQREQSLRRTAEDWEELALKVMLYNSKWAAWVRDHYDWKLHFKGVSVLDDAPYLMKLLGITGTCAPTTFLGGIQKALRRLKREARQAIQENRRVERDRVK